MKRKILSLIMVLVMALGIVTPFSYAAISGETTEISPMSTFSVGFTYRRYSDTKAAASVDVVFTGIADDYEVTIILQKKSGTSWVTATDVAKNTIKYIGSNEPGVLTYDEWTVKKGVVYRIKCVSTDKYDRGIEYTRTNYSDPF